MWSTYNNDLQVMKYLIENDVHSSIDMCTSIEHKNEVTLKYSYINSISTNLIQKIKFLL